MAKREEIIKKIACMLFSEEEYNKATKDNELEKKAQEHTNELFEKCASASKMLKTAAHELRQVKAEKEVLAAQVSDLIEKINLMEKHDEAEKLAQTMVQKGMLKAADVDGKIIELMALDNEGFSIVKDAIENVNIEKNASSTGVNSFDFMYDIDSSDGIDYGEDKPSMADAIEKCIK